MYFSSYISLYRGAINIQYRDVAREVNVASLKSTKFTRHIQVNWPRNFHDQLIWYHLRAICTVGSDLDFRLCARSPVVEITVYTAHETQ